MDIGTKMNVEKVHFSFYGQRTVPKRPCFFSNSSHVAYSQSESDTRAESTKKALSFTDENVGFEELFHGQYQRVDAYQKKANHFRMNDVGSPGV